MKAFLILFSAIVAAGVVSFGLWSYWSSNEVETAETRALIAKAAPWAHDFAGITKIAPDTIRTADFDRVRLEAELVAFHAKPAHKSEILEYTEDLGVVLQFSRSRWPEKKAEADDLARAISRMRTGAGIP